MSKIVRCEFTGNWGVLLILLADYGVNTFDLSEEELTHDFKSA